MSWIEVNQGIMKAIWIDGYLPSPESLEITRQKYLDLDKGGYLVKRSYLSYSDDEMFKRLAMVIKGDCETGKPKGGDLSYLFHHCDLYLTRFLSTRSSDIRKAVSLIKPSFKLGHALKTELMRENRAENYRQIIVTFSPYVCSTGDQCTRDIINKVNFKSRDPKEYDNFDDFKKDCQIFLERYFLEPYIAPCMITENRLNLIGFEIKEPDI